MAAIFNIILPKRMNIKRWLIGFCLFLISPTIQAQPGKDTSIVYIYQAAPSFEVRVLKIAARTVLLRNSISKKLSKDHFVSDAATIPKQLFTEFNIDTTRVYGRNVYRISPKGKKSGKYVLYLHGGAYINNIFRQHWLFAAKIIRETNCTFILPDYPLAPAATYEDAFAMLEAIYKSLLSETDAKNIILMGDSAGGGLALALAEKQKSEGTAQAGQIILLSPWIDVSMSNPEIKEIQKKDVTLNADDLVMAGKVWSGKSETSIYLVSPVNGSLEGLPKISVFIGTHDILYADCSRLKMIMKQKGIPINYYEYPKMFHDWMILVSLIESEKALSQICWLVLN